ncbi:phage integrase family protein [Sphaerotilus sp.]|uniref:phage integrase family protein n=1 Tax=Sphaerotilus sp. TaxID=2093942 RepID=UPI00286E93C3|nr:phage integrase family protein [Sphaerotilus sp.]
MNATEATKAQESRPRGRPRGTQTRLLHEHAGHLGRHHFAFLRALLDGVELEQAWTRYLAFSGGPSDRRHFVSRLRQVVEAIEHAGARRACMVELAVALPALSALPDFVPTRGARRAPLSQTATAFTATAAPSLDDWRSAQCGASGIDEDFYTQAEWVDLYGEAFGHAPPASASASMPALALSATAHAHLAETAHPEVNPRLTSAQRRAVIDALATLERVLAREARLDDETGFWLGAGLPRELARVGVQSLGDLVRYINLQGFRWHRTVSRLGAVRATRLVAWLVPIAQQGDQALLDSALRPESDLARLRQRDLARAPVTDLAALAGGTDPLMPVAVPVMDMALPDALSGRDGLFRSPDTNVWGAQTDVQAIQQWLSRYQGQTRRDYARIAERFYRWCLQVRRTALSSLQEPDIQAYQAFVSAPPADWVQPRKVRREDAAWRPFRGPLGRNSQRHEFAVLGGLFAAMHDKGYLRANAMSGLGRTLGLVKPSIDVRRSLNEAQWSFAMVVLRERPDTPARRRLQLLLDLASTTGLRLSELATTRMKGLRQELVDGESAWLLDVIGKGGKLRTVMVFDDIKALMEQHHADMDAARVGFEDAVERVQVPNSRPTTAAGERMASGDQEADAVASTGGALQDALRAEHLQAWRPLIGILRRPPPRRDLDARGVPFVDREQPSQADRYGALERSAIYRLLRRFFTDVANAAATREGAPPAAEFLKASTHWLRHTFANEAIKQMQPQVLQSLLGHSDLRVTSVYVKAQAADLVRGMRALPRKR